MSDSGAAPPPGAKGQGDTARRWLRRLLEWATLFLMASLAVVVVLGVGFRKAGASLVWYDEVASILLAWLTYYGAALAALDRAHIGVPTLVDTLPPRLRIGVILVAEALGVAFFVVLGWAGLRVQAVLGGTTLVSLPWVPMAFAQSVIPIGAALFVLASILSLPAALSPAGANGPDADPPGTGGGGVPGTPDADLADGAPA